MTSETLQKIMQSDQTQTNFQLAWRYLQLNPLYRRFYQQMDRAVGLKNLSAPNEFLGEEPTLYSLYRRRLFSFGLETLVDPEAKPEEVDYGIWSRHFINPNVSVIPSCPEQGEDFHQWKKEGVWPRDYGKEFVYVKIPLFSNVEDIQRELSELLPALGIERKASKAQKVSHEKRLAVYRFVLNISDDIGLVRFKSGERIGQFSFISKESGGLSKKGWRSRLSKAINRDESGAPDIICQPSNQEDADYDSTIAAHVKEAQEYVFGGYKKLITSGKYK